VSEDPSPRPLSFLHSESIPRKSQLPTLGNEKTASTPDPLASGREVKRAVTTQRNSLPTNLSLSFIIRSARACQRLLCSIFSWVETMSAGVELLALEETKRRLSQADEKRKTTVIQVCLCSLPLKRVCDRRLCWPLRQKPPPATVVLRSSLARQDAHVSRLFSLALPAGGSAAGRNRSSEEGHVRAIATTRRAPEQVGVYFLGKHCCVAAGER